MVDREGPNLTTAQLDRSAGVLLAQACGDALGVPYDFGPVLPDEERPRMLGGGLGPYAPGEYSDHTQMAACVAEVAATGADLTDGDALDEIAERFLQWLAEGATDVGTQTRSVLSHAQQGSGGRRRGCGKPPRRCTSAAERQRATGR